MSSLYRFLHRHAGLLLGGFTVAALLASPFVLRFGMLHPEVYFLLPHYLGPKSFLEKIFDPSGTDTGLYLGRELSYVFDYLDCQIIAWGVDHGTPHFLSTTHYVFMALTAAAMWWFARHRAGLPRVGAALLVGLFLSTPAVLLGGSFFRSAKQGVALCAVLCVCGFARAFRPAPSDGKFPWPAWTVAFTGATAMGLFDRQGFFFVLVLAALLFIRVRERHGLVWFSGAALAAVLTESYNRLIGPALVARLSGHAASLDFQSLPLADVVADREMLFNILFYAPQLMLDNLRFLLGDMPSLLAAMALAYAVLRLAPAWSFVATPGPWLRTRALECLLAASVPLALVVMNGLMILRVKAMLGLDFRRIYYGLPSIAVLWILVAIAVGMLARRLRRQWLWAGLTVLLLCNLAALVEHRHIIRAGLYRDHYRVSPTLLATLRRLPELPPPTSGPLRTLATEPEKTAPEVDSIVRFFHQRRERLSSPLTPP